MAPSPPEPWTKRVLYPLLYLFVILTPPLMMTAAFVGLTTDRDLIATHLLMAAAIAYLLAVALTKITISGVECIFATSFMTIICLPFVLVLGIVHLTTEPLFDPARKAYPPISEAYTPDHTILFGEPFPFLERRPVLRAEVAAACAAGGGLVNGIPVERYTGTVVEPPTAEGGLSVAGSIVSVAGSIEPRPPHPAILFVETAGGRTVLMRPRSHAWKHPALRVGATAFPGDRVDACAVPGPDANWFPRFGIVGDEPHYAEATATYAQAFWLLDMSGSLHTPASARSEEGQEP